VWITLQILLTGLLSLFFFLFNTLIMIINATLHWNFNCNFNKLMLSNCTNSPGNSPIVLCLHKLTLGGIKQVSAVTGSSWTFYLQTLWCLMTCVTYICQQCWLSYFPSKYSGQKKYDERTQQPYRYDPWNNLLRKHLMLMFFISVSTTTNTKKRQEIVILNLTVFY